MRPRKEKKESFVSTRTKAILLLISICIAFYYLWNVEIGSVGESWSVESFFGWFNLWYVLWFILAVALLVYLYRYFFKKKSDGAHVEVSHDKSHAGAHAGHKPESKVWVRFVQIVVIVFALIILRILWVPIVQLFGGDVYVVPHDESSEITLASGSSSDSVHVALDPGEAAYLSYYNYNSTMNRNTKTGTILIQYGQDITLPAALYYTLRSANHQSFWVDVEKFEYY